MRLTIKDIICAAVFVMLSSISALTVAEDTVSPTPGKQVHQSFQTSDDATVQYLLYLPKEHAPGEKYPLLLFLHGRGESYGPLDLVAKWGPPRMAARGDHFPMIVVSPQCPALDHWGSEPQQRRVNELLDLMIEKHDADPQRMYVTGLSMGGTASWKMAAAKPARFAASAPLCGLLDASDAEHLKHVPVWVFHGDLDSALPIADSEASVKAVKKVGGTKIRFTSMENFGHNVWCAAYASPELYKWMLRQKLP